MPPRLRGRARGRSSSSRPSASHRYQQNLFTSSGRGGQRMSAPSGRSGSSASHRYQQNVFRAQDQRGRGTSARGRRTSSRGRRTSSRGRTTISRGSSGSHRYSQNVFRVTDSGGGGRRTSSAGRRTSSGARRRPPDHPIEHPDNRNIVVDQWENNPSEPQWLTQWSNWSAIGPPVYIPMGRPLSKEQLAWLNSQRQTSDVKNIQFGSEEGRSEHGVIWGVTATVGGVQSKLICRVRPLKRSTKDILDSVEEMLNDVRVLIGLNHPNINRFIDIIGIPHPKSGFPFSIILLFTEWCDENLTYLMERLPNYNIPEVLCKHWFRQIAEAVNYLHTQENVAHLDIKPEHILFQLPPGQRLNKTAYRNIQTMTFKLSGFRYARRYADPNNCTATTSHGTPDYMPPETDGRVHEVSAKPWDVFSLGVCLAAALLEQKLFKKHVIRERNVFDVMEQALAGNRLKNISQSAASLIRAMTSPDLNARITIQEVLGHEWVERGAQPGGAQPQSGAQPQGGAQSQGLIRPPWGYRPPGVLPIQGGAQPQGGFRPRGGFRPQGVLAIQGGAQPQGGFRPQGGAQPQGGTQPQRGPQPQSNIPDFDDGTGGQPIGTNRGPDLSPGVMEREWAQRAQSGQGMTMDQLIQLLQNYDPDAPGARFGHRSGHQPQSRPQTQSNTQPRPPSPSRPGSTDPRSSGRDQSRSQPQSNPQTRPPSPSRSRPTDPRSGGRDQSVPQPQRSIPLANLGGIGRGGVQNGPQPSQNGVQPQSGPQQQRGFQPQSDIPVGFHSGIGQPSQPIQTDNGPDPDPGAIQREWAQRGGQPMTMEQFDQFFQNYDPDAQQ